MYCIAVTDAEKEEELIRKALAKIDEIRVIRNERRILVRYRIEIFKFRNDRSLVLICRQSRQAVRKPFAEVL